MPTQLTTALEEQIKDLYSAEVQLTKALPKMARAAQSETLRAGFQDHLEETREHVERLKQAAAMLELKPGGKKCGAMEGLIEEGSEAISEHEKGPLRDALLIAAAQRVEHYEIAAYGTVRAMAEHLGHADVAQLFEETLSEEKASDSKLTAVSEEEILPIASRLDEDEDKSQRDPDRNKGSRGQKARGSARSSGRRAAR